MIVSASTKCRLKTVLNTGSKYAKLKMQQPVNTNPVQVVVIAQPLILDKQSLYKNMKRGLARQLIGLGITQLLIGILCIIFQGIAVGIFVNQRYFGYSLDFVGHGFWNGIIFLITGPFGIAGGFKRNRCQVVAFNVLSILSAAFAACLLAIAIPGAIFYAIGQRNCDYVYYATTTTNSYYYSNYDYYRCYPSGTRETGIAMEAMMAILALIEVIIAIRSSVICCTIGACCCNCGGSCCCPPAPPQQFLMTGQPFPGQQQIIIANQQQSGSNQQPQMFVTNQPPTFAPNSQQLMFSPNQQQPIFAVSPQQPIHLDPRQQMAQYHPQQPNPPPYHQQSSAYTALTPAPKVQGPYTGLYTGMRDTIIAPEQSGRPTATDYYESPE